MKHVGIALLWVMCACDGDDAPRGGDGGDAGADATVTATHIDIWARLPGATATVDGASMVLGDEGGVLTIAPPIAATTTTLRLEGASGAIELMADWSADYAYLDLAADTPLEALTLAVMIGEAGDCTLGTTNGRAAGNMWSGLYAHPIGACGPFGFRVFRLELVGSNCAPGDSCVGLIELSSDGTLRVDEFGGTEDFVEAAVSADDLVRARVIFGDAQLLALLSMERPCPPVTDSSAPMVVETPLEALRAETAGCDAPPIAAARDLAYELAESYAP